MSKVHFFKLDEPKRIWAMTLADNDSATAAHGYFTSMTAISFSRLLKDKHGIDASIKKAYQAEINAKPIGGIPPFFRVLIKFDNEEDEAMFLLKCSGGFEL